jgi:hypothetical protein
MSGISHSRRERRQHEQQRNFVRMPHRETPRLTAARFNSSLKEFLFRIIGKHRRAVYHQLDGSIELASACTCRVHFSVRGISQERSPEGQWYFPDVQPPRVERSEDCPIDEHRMEAFHLARREDVA